MTTTDRPFRGEADIRAELDRPGAPHFTRGEIRALLDELDRLRAMSTVTGAAARVAALPTANDGQLIAASREQILDAITRTGQEG